ncbi:MAG: single-stranded-DNA-specific exonuclease RecJ [Ruminococcaceae bacterium]|nr:single-stranded-DNA-specific exonuclease RecJ [Oscillospiraceae bacterium]
MAFKQWKISDYDKVRAKELMDTCDVDAVTAVLLTSRGITEPEQIRAFFSDTCEYIDPFTLPDMDLAVERIGAAIDSGEKIAIFGDFDCDGVTSTALLYLYLRSCGADVIYYIPDRNAEGYGLNIDAIKQFKSQNVSLIITVDNGISALNEVAFANENGIDVVVTDHHMQGSLLPDAVAVVNPHRNDSECEYEDWAGVGVTFKLVSALAGGEEEILEEYADLICIGTIADIVPVLGENRFLIKKGLELINDTKRLGIAALKGVAGVSQKQLTAGDIAFVISPRINAAGRISSAKKAVELLVTDDAPTAIRLAEEIQECNTKRIQIENEMLEDACNMLADDSFVHDRVLVLCKKGWNSGIAGIVASKICERYGKPAIIITDSGESVLKGSCRSLKGFNIFEALSACCDCLKQFGGHTLAAGLSVERERVEEFRALINDYAAKMFRYMPSGELNIDFKINPASINLDVLRALNRFQPFGMGNAKPLFGVFNAKILMITPISGNKHIKITLAKNNTTFSAIYFGYSTESIPFRKGDRVDVALHIEKNEYYGKTTISLFLKAIRYSGFSDSSILNGLRIFENFMRSETTKNEMEFLLTGRDNIAQIYRFLRDNNGWQFSTEELYMCIKPVRMNYSQMRLSLAIMIELGIVIADAQRGRIDLPIEPEKVNISDSRLYRKMMDLSQTL